MPCKVERVVHIVTVHTCTQKSFQITGQLEFLSSYHFELTQTQTKELYFFLAAIRRDCNTITHTLCFHFQRSIAFVVDSGVSLLRE